ncbi:MAG: hypothetical protein U9P12_01310 [Verrucomicrobiota bacterium]|nr:hypothetical protein [Verrucomicrobiota bacterium]
MKLFFRYFFLSLLLAGCVLVPILAGIGEGVAEENGVLENVQIALLMLSALVFVAQSFSVGRPFRFILWAGAWFCLSCILRELDVEDFSVPQWVAWVGSGLGRNLILVAGWIVLGVVAIRTYVEWRELVPRMLCSRSAAYFVASGILLATGALFDHEWIAGGHARLLEEIFESLGYSLLLPASLLSKSIFGNREMALATQRFRSRRPVD